MKFNHDANDMTTALGITDSAEEVAEAITNAIEKWIRDEQGFSKNSKLSESLHNNLPYEIILFLATKEVFRKFKDTFNDLDVVKDLLKELSDLADQVRENDNPHLN